MKLVHALFSIFLVFSLYLNADKTPNVIFFAVDDMNDWISPMGSNRAQTPNLQRLADMGVTFQNGHTAGIYCAPSRSAIFTGRFATTTGCYTEQVYFYNHPEYLPLQTAFHENGYSTYGTGKLFHHPEGMVDQRGWTEFYTRTKIQKESGWAMDSWKLDAPLPKAYPASKFNQANPKWKGKSFMEVGTIENSQEKDMADTIRTEWACDVIQKDHEKPFFLALGLYAPHYPNYAPQKYFDLYPLDEITLPTYKEDDTKDIPAKLQKKYHIRKTNIHDKLVQLDALKSTIQGYLACITYADAMLGRVLDALENSSHKDNTIIVFWSDHGYAQGQKGQWGKHTLWERTSNVPFLWSGPGIAKGKSCENTASLIDIYPTLVDLCQLKKDKGLEGISLRASLTQPKKHEPRTILLPHDHPGSYAMINRDWRYIHYKGIGEELYHTAKDQHEWHNLADKPEYENIKQKLKAQAPKKFAEPGLSKKKLQLVVEGTSFKWVPKK